MMEKSTPKSKKSSPTLNLTYEAASEELASIVEDIQSGDISMDVLAEKLKRAALLVKFCSEKLRKTEQEVQNILSDLDAPSLSSDSADQLES